MYSGLHDRGLPRVGGCSRIIPAQRYVVFWIVMSPPVCDRAQFGKYLETGLDDLYRAALRLTRNPDDAQDLVADTVEKAWNCIDTLQDPERIGAWMKRIMTNHFISERRKAVHRTPHEEYTEEREDDDAPFSLFERLHQPFLLWWSNPEQKFLDQVLQEHITAALAELPESFRMVIVLADMEGMKYEEISQALEVPVGTVRSRLARARSQLQKCLWQQAIDAGIVAPPLSEDL